MTVLDMNPATLPADARSLYETMAARRKVRGEHFGGPYVALLNHPELARRIEELGFFLKFEGTLPRTIYQFIVLTIARATGADYEWHDHIAHARAAGLPADVIDASARSRTATLSGPMRCACDPGQDQAGRWCRTICRRGRGAGEAGLVEIVVLSGFYQMFAATRINPSGGTQSLRERTDRGRRAWHDLAARLAQNRTVVVTGSPLYGVPIAQTRWGPRAGMTSE